MGLRFRKSVKICDGLRLNFGKTGASVTFGSGPFKKTYNTNGNVTTTVGIPGTGIYWTETERRGSRNNRRTSTMQQAEQSLQSQQRDYQVAAAVEDYFIQADAAENNDVVVASESRTPVIVSKTINIVPHSQSISQVNVTDSNEKKELSAEDIRRIYLYEDAPVDWTEIIAGATADDLLMDQSVHTYCARMAPRILSGDVDAYLEVIEKMCPVDDLALYIGDYEFGTDQSSYIEVEFVARPEMVFRDSTTDVLLEEFISAVAIRVARDLFALLPVTKVLVHVEINGNTVLSVIFTRKQLCSINFRNNSANAIVKQFSCQISSNYYGAEDIDRMQI